jgi:hypothetical protein
MRKTARISFFVEYDDEHEDPMISFENCNDIPDRLVALNVEQALLIGTPRIDQHNWPVCSLSFAEVNRLIGVAQIHGGSFDKTLTYALGCADHENSQRITEEFWNLLCRYRSNT